MNKHRADAVAVVVFFVAGSVAFALLPDNVAGIGPLIGGVIGFLAGLLVGRHSKPE